MRSAARGARRERERKVLKVVARNTVSIRTLACNESCSTSQHSSPGMKSLSSVRPQISLCR